MSRTAICVGCGRTIETVDGYKVHMKNRGERTAYFCYSCRTHECSVFSYSEENHKRRGNAKVNGYTFSIELETCGCTHDGMRGANDKGRAELLNKGFLPSHDGTVDIEFKSPIYEGLNAPIAFINKGVYPLMRSGDIVIDHHCGTHFHVGQKEYINRDNMVAFLRQNRLYHRLFDRMNATLIENPEECKRLFGRMIGGWADNIRGEDAIEHTNWINVQHDNTIEFRICKLNTADQYCEAMRTCKKIVEILIDGFLSKENKTVTDMDKTSRRMDKALRKAMGL